MSSFITYLLLGFDTFAYVIAAYYVLSVERIGCILLLLAGRILQVSRQTITSIAGNLHSRFVRIIWPLTFSPEDSGDPRSRDAYLFKEIADNLVNSCKQHFVKLAYDLIASDLHLHRGALIRILLQIRYATWNLICESRAEQYPPKIGKLWHR